MEYGYAVGVIQWKIVYNGRVLYRGRVLYKVILCKVVVQWNTDVQCNGYARVLSNERVPNKAAFYHHGDNLPSKVRLCNNQTARNVYMSIQQ